MCRSLLELSQQRFGMVNVKYDRFAFHSRIGRTIQARPRWREWRVRLIVVDHATNLIGSDPDEASLIPRKPGAIGRPSEKPVPVDLQEIDRFGHEASPEFVLGEPSGVSPRTIAYY